MIENIFLLIIAAAVLGFTGLLWLRGSLLHELRDAKEKEAILKKDFEKRRDTVPYLLESARAASEPTDSWRKLVEDRAQFQKAQPYEKELEFERSLHNYLSSNTIRTVNFLEAKKDIEELSQLIEKQKQERQDALSRFNERRKQFPYSLASGIFGFREIKA